MTEAGQQNSLPTIAASTKRYSQPVKILRVWSWLVLLACAILAAVAIIWSTFVTIPITIETPSVALTNGSVVQAISRDAGRVTNVAVKNGDEVQMGQPIATVATDKGSTYVRSPINGYVMNLLMPVGALVSPLQAVANVEFDQGNVYIYSFLAPATAQRVIVGQPVTITFTGTSGSTSIFRSKVSNIGAPMTADQASSLLGDPALSQLAISDPVVVPILVESAPEQLEALESEFTISEDEEFYWSSQATFILGEKRPIEYVFGG